MKVLAAYNTETTTCMHCKCEVRPFDGFFLDSDTAGIIRHMLCSHFVKGLLLAEQESVETDKGNNFVRSLVNEYNVTRELSPVAEHYAPIDETLSTKIAQEYALAPTVDDSAFTAYAQLAREIQEQFDFASQFITFEVWSNEKQPYQNSAELCKDVRENKHLAYFTGGESHPFLGHTNNLFRAVHDLFGHVAEGFQFGPRGEENAWIHHSMMFSPLAQLALTTETRGQNSWVNFGPYRKLAANQRPYAPQKCFLLPLWACDYTSRLSA